MTYVLPAVARPSKKHAFAFVVPDVHYGYNTGLPSYDPLVWDVGLQAISHYKDRMTHLIILGDFGNCESLSHWASLRAEQVYIEEDINLIDMALGDIERALGKKNKTVKKVFIEGNHEAWATMLEAKYPQFRNEVNLPVRLDLKQRGWQWVPNNHFYKLGLMHFTHGNIRGASTPQKMLHVNGVSTMYGHTHRRLYATMNNVGGELEAHSIGCWASIDPPPPYAKGVPPAQWEHGFATVQVRKNGRFQVQHMKIYDSSVCELPDATELVANRGTAQARIKRDKAMLAKLQEAYSDRYYEPGGSVHEPEPLRGTELRSRAQRARVHGGK